MQRVLRTSTLALTLVLALAVGCTAPGGGGGGSLGSARTCLNGGSFGPKGTADGYPYQQVAYGISNVSGRCLSTEVTLRTYRIRTSGDQLIRTQVFTLPLGTGTNSDLISAVDVTPYVTAANTPGNPAQFRATYSLRADRYDDFTADFAATVNRNCILMPAGC